MTDIDYADPAPLDEMPKEPWYHTVDVPGHGVVRGIFDFRANAGEYLGDYDFNGKRVLEIGPATGFLTFWMENQGADVTIIDLDLEDSAWDKAPSTDPNFDHHYDLQVRSIKRTRGTWWYLHQKFQSKSKAVYCGIYNIPENLGKFDVVVMSAVLLHLRYPFDALEKISAFADTIVFADRRLEHLEKPGGPIMQFVPNARNRVWNTWWQFSSAAVQNMLEILGYTRFDVTNTKVNIASRENLDEFSGDPYFCIVANK